MLIREAACPDRGFRSLWSEHLESVHESLGESYSREAVRFSGHIVTVMRTAGNVDGKHQPPTLRHRSTLC
jgi:hypothetical protein